MTIPDELGQVIRAVESTGLKYCLTGSLASTTWGRPRATYDADILIELTARDVDALLTAFPPPDWYLDRSTAIEAIESSGEFNAIHAPTGTKVDFWVRPRTPSGAARLARRLREQIAGVPCWVLSPEDTILAKLEWFRAAPSDRQKQDVSGIIELRADALDYEYLREWAERLGVRDLLDQAIHKTWDQPGPG